MSKIKIAIAEDDNNLRLLFSQILASTGEFEIIIEAKDGFNLISQLERLY